MREEETLKSYKEREMELTRDQKQSIIDACLRNTDCELSDADRFGVEVCDNGTSWERGVLLGSTEGSWPFKVILLGCESPVYMSYCRLPEEAEKPVAATKKELSREEKQDIINNYDDGALKVAPFEVEVRFDDDAEWEVGMLCAVASQKLNGYPYKVWIPEDSLVTYFSQCRLPEEEKEESKEEEPTKPLQSRKEWLEDREMVVREAIKKIENIYSAKGEKSKLLDELMWLIIQQNELFQKEQSTPEPQTRPMTAREIAALAMEGAEFVWSEQTSFFNPCIKMGLDAIRINGSHLEDFYGYRLEEGGELLPFTVTG